jgi:hypothetical protein
MQCAVKQCKRRNHLVGCRECGEAVCMWHRATWRTAEGQNDAICTRCKMRMAQNETEARWARAQRAGRG